MLQGQMMDRPLMISDIVTYAAEIRGDQEIVSARVEGDRHRYTYKDLAGRAAQLAGALRKLGIGPGDRVATLAWNGYRHLELYYGISGIGAVCHTINPRLFAEQIVYVVGHAKDKVLFLDATFVPLVQGLRDRLPKGLRYVVLGDETHGLEGALAYEALLAEQPAEIDWPVFDERTASGICYTSGTTGHPKGVLYTHRSTLLHSYGLMAIATEVGLTPTDSILPVVPLFHVNAWGLPYAMPLTGTRIVMPGPKLDGENLFRLMEEEAVTSAWGVPTVWLGLLGEMRKQGRKPDGSPAVLSDHADVRRMLHTQRCLALGARAMCHLALVELELGQRPQLAEFLTPLCKIFCTEAGMRSADLGIQALGGYGYLQEYRVEQTFRDARITAIYEGANGIHELGLATRGLTFQKGAGADAFADLVSELADGDADVLALLSAWRELREEVVASEKPADLAHSFAQASAQLFFRAVWVRMTEVRSHAPDPAEISELGQFAGHELKGSWF
ncbi:AMP-binding protein [Thalassobaculum salexigens]|uniref:AMP-binding protein n=1 Tax=Thalassobaculum salexigens TaxID=455360 RepID=UPI00248EE72E|nr:AMP-binding protein [Thalassobaculum salexigens]